MTKKMSLVSAARNLKICVSNDVRFLTSFQNDIFKSILECNLVLYINLILFHRNQPIKTNMKKLIFLLLAFVCIDCFSQDSSQIYFDTAFELLSNGNNQKAVVYYEKAIKLNPNNADIWLEYTSCLRQNKRFQEAIIAGWKTLELAPDSYKIWTTIGNTYVDCHHWKQAFDAFEEFKKSNTVIQQNSKNFITLGYEQMLYKDYEGAEKSFKYALEIESDNALALIDLGVVYLCNGDSTKGKEYIKHGIELAKKNNDNYEKYGEGILEEFQVNKRLNFPTPVGRSFQVLPERFLDFKNTKNLKVDEEVERLVQITPVRIFSIKTPFDWSEYTNKKDEMITVDFTTNEGFKVLITPLTQYYSLLDSAMIKEIVLSSAEEILPNASEESYKIEEFKNDLNYGYYTTMTDKNFAGKEDDFNIITSGSLMSEKLPSIFTILTNEKGNIISKYLDILKKIEIKKK